MANTPKFAGTIENPLFKQTDWGEHMKITVGVYGRFKFNDTPVEGLIEIIQQSSDDADEEWDDFRDMEGEGRIATTAEGARTLASLLLKAADAAEARGSDVVDADAEVPTAE